MIMFPTLDCILPVVPNQPQGGRIIKFEVQRKFSLYPPLFPSVSTIYGQKTETSYNKVTNIAKDYCLTRTQSNIDL